MCYAGNCHPECDNCKPKYLWCPTCGTRVFLMRKACPTCGCEFTDEMREEARAKWKEAHPYSSGNFNDFKTLD